MSREREILILERAAMPDNWLPHEGILPLSWSALCREISSCDLRWRWMPRSEAENDPCWKQPIPYILLRDRNKMVALYQRCGTESRLDGCCSVGVGGHVERVDDAGSLPETLLACARRELAEEILGCRADLHFLGMINEEITAVGRVHWGLLFTANLTEPVVASNELGELRWLPPKQAATLELEIWSRLALKLQIQQGGLYE